MDISMKILTKNLFTDKKLKPQKQAEYLLVLSRLTMNGFSIKQAINCLKMLEDKNDIFDLIYQDLQMGEMIAHAMRHLKLPPVINNQLMIAQSNGGLQQTLFQSGMILQNKSRQKEKLMDLLAYPAFIMLFLVVMLVGMKVYIIPQMNLANDSDLINIFIMSIISLIVLTFVGITYFIYRLKKMTEYQRATVLIKLPIIGKTYASFFQFIILQGLGMQVGSGMNLHDICSSSQLFEQGSIQCALSYKFSTGMGCGKNIYSLIENEPLLPNELKMILQSGGSTKEIGQDLILMSELKFEETQRRLKKILNLVQPILFGVIAIVILVTYLIVLLPVYGMMKGLT